MKDEIAKIMRKKNPTGTDLGRLIFFLDMESLLSKKKGGEFAERQQIQQYHWKFLGTLDVEQTLYYYSFFGLYNIVQTYNYLGQGFYQQALRCYFHILLIITGKTSVFTELKSVSDEFDVSNLKNDVDAFLMALRNSFAIDQFFLDVEKIHKLEGLHKSYCALGDLSDYIKSYNDAIAAISKEKNPKYTDILSTLPVILAKDYLPRKKFQQEARKYMKDIRVFNDRVTSREFFNAYLDGVHQ